MKNKLQYYIDKYGPWILVGGGLLLSYLGNRADYNAQKEIDRIEENKVVYRYKPKNLEKIDLEVKNEF